MAPELIQKRDSSPALPALVCQLPVNQCFAKF